MILNRTTILAGLIAILLAGCKQAAPPPTPTPAAMPTATAELKTIESSRSGVTIVADGYLVAPNPVLPLAFSAAGRLEKILVKAGDEVKAGDLIAELDILLDDYEDNLAQAKLELESAEAALDKAEQELADALVKANISLETSQIRLEQAQKQDLDTPINIAYIRLGQAERNLADVQDAYNQAWEPARDWELNMTKPTGVYPYEGPSLKDQLEAERNSTEHALASAQDSLQIARAEYSQAAMAKEVHNYDLQVLPQDIKLTEFQIEQLERGVDPSLNLNVERARLQVQILERKMEKLTADSKLYAPWDGVVLGVESAIGVQVSAATPIVTLLDTGNLEFHTTNLSERDLAQVAPGGKAQVTMKTYPDQRLEGIIYRIAPQSGGTVGDAASFTVVIQLDQAGLELRPGMTGRVEILTK